MATTTAVRPDKATAKLEKAHAKALDALSAHLSGTPSKLKRAAMHQYVEKAVKLADAERAAFQALTPPAPATDGTAPAPALEQPGEA